MNPSTRSYGPWVKIHPICRKSRFERLNALGSPGELESFALQRIRPEKRGPADAAKGRSGGASRGGPAFGERLARCGDGLGGSQRVGDDVLEDGDVFEEPPPSLVGDPADG